MLPSDSVLAIDLSTKAGWAFFSSMDSTPEYGLISLEKKPIEIGAYPYGYTQAAKIQTFHLAELIKLKKPSVVVVETVNNGRSRFTQQLLNFLHFALIDWCQSHGVEIKYIDSMQWRTTLGLAMSKEEKKANAKLSKAKRAAAAVGKAVDKKALGIKGKVTVKHLAVAYANERYGLKLLMKDNDVADALCLGASAYMGAQTCLGIY